MLFPQTVGKLKRLEQQKFDVALLAPDHKCENENNKVPIIDYLNSKDRHSLFALFHYGESIAVIGNIYWLV